MPKPDTLIGSGRASTVSRKSALCWAAMGLVLLLHGINAHAETLEVRRNDSVVILGNTFARRMLLFGYFEAFLQSRFPNDQLRVRNMGWSADEVDKMIRPMGFPKLHDELTDHQADLIFVCFGMNESFAGLEGIPHFRGELGKFVTGLLESQFNGRSAPRIVLVSPVAHENLGGDLPNDRGEDRNLKQYVETMKQVAEDQGVFFVDLLTPTSRWIVEHPETRLTFNGIHLTEYGDWVVSQMMARELGLIDEVSPPDDGGTANRGFRRLIYEKNYWYHLWWHPPNASYIHGRRNQTQGARHLGFERGQSVRLVDDFDRKIWAADKPRPADIWQDLPVDGKPIWFPTPRSRSISGVTNEATWSVRGDGEPGMYIRSPEEQLKLMAVPKGYQINLFASEVRFPIANPTAIQFDSHGRLWVANTPTWPHPLPGKQPTDSIVVLEDTDHDGAADRHSVYLDQMNLIHGFGLVGDDVLVAQTPDMLVTRDTDEDGKADWFQMVLHGFGAEDAEHAMNNFRWSSDGSIYLTQGIFYNTQVETPYGPVRVRDAAVFRYRPVEHRLGVYVADFYTHIFENVNFSKRHPGRDHSHGRIWRISYQNRAPLKPPQIAGRPVGELLDRLKAHEITTREFARPELQQRGQEAVIPALNQWVAVSNPAEEDHEHHLAEALWVRQSLNAIDVDLLKRQLASEDSGARVAATQVLRFWQDRIEGSMGLIRKQVNDRDPRVRLQAILVVADLEGTR